MTLTEFLLARIAEDEERAKFVQRENARGWGPETFESWRLSWMDEYDLLCIEPERALAECEAKRRIVEEHEHDLSGKYGSDKPGCWCCHHDRDYELIPRGWCRTLRALALPYADHPDCREEWKP